MRVLASILADAGGIAWVAKCPVKRRHEKAFVRRVKRPMCIGMVRFWRSTCVVLTSGPAIVAGPTNDRRARVHHQG